jgi:hypothetical protein
VLAQRCYLHHRTEDVVTAEVLSCLAAWEHLGVGGKVKPSPDPGFDQLGLLVAVCSECRTYQLVRMGRNRG